MLQWKTDRLLWWTPMQNTAGSPSPIARTKPTYLLWDERILVIQTKLTGSILQLYSPDLSHPVTNADFNTCQTIDAYCNQIAAWLDKPRPVYLYNRISIIFRQSKVDSAVQKVVPVALRVLILYLSHYPILAGHPRKRRFYDKLRMEL